MTKRLTICCCCFSIYHGTIIVGTLDLLGFVGTFIQIILLFLSKEAQNVSFYACTYLFTSIPALLLLRTPRLISFLFLIRARNKLRMRDIYFRIRFVTFILQIVFTCCDLVLYSLDLSAKIRIKYFVKRINGDDTNCLFVVALLQALLIFVLGLFDWYFCLVAQQYRDNLFTELTKA